MPTGTATWVQSRSSHSNKAVWQCNKCPAGQPHISRTEGAQCPYCSNRLVCLHNSLATLALEAAQYWNHSKNEKSADQVLAGSNCRAAWKCPACNREWHGSMKGRIRNRSGCPKCSRAQKVMRSQPTFAEAQPACLAEWDSELNKEDSFYPDVITLGSAKSVH